MSDDVTPTSLLLAVRRAAVGCEAALAEELHAAGLSQEEWRIVSALSGAPGLTMSDLARAAACAPPTATRLVERLVSRAWAYRRIDAADRRRVVVHLSARGRRSTEAVRRTEEAVESRLMNELGETRYRNLIASLTHLQQGAISPAS